MNLILGNHFTFSHHLLDWFAAFGPEAILTTTAAAFALKVYSSYLRASVL